MKHLAAALGAVAMLGVTGASAETVFSGIIRVTAATPQCEFFNEEGGRTFTSRFHPRIAGNADFTGLSFIQPLYAIGYSLEGASFTNAFQVVRSGGVGWGETYTYTPGSAIKITSMTPPTLTASTPQVLLRGQVRRPEDDPGGNLCIITFIGSYVLEPL